MTKARPEILKYRRFFDLMPHRVREVLLVSSLYDAFTLQEDGHLTEQVFLEYKSLALSSAPRFTHVTTGEEAIAALQRRRFDLVLAMPRLADADLVEFARRVKLLRTGRPVVVLAFDNREVERLRSLADTGWIDGVFSWNGDATILLAIIKYIEDRANIDHDIAVADVRAILLVEDSIRFTSEFLADLYPVLMKQSQSLFAEGLNTLQKLLRMRTRPKILHAANYEAAMGLFDRYENNIIALIADVGFPRRGRLERDAGLQLTAEIRRRAPDLPILLQSANEEFAPLARNMGALFLNKTSTSLLHEVNAFLRDYLGFGEFVFRMPDGEEIGRAADLREFEQALETIPLECFEYHARRNHFSNWLMARSEFELAAKLRPQKVVDFPSLEDVRRHLVREVRLLRRGGAAGMIADFSLEHFDPDSQFQRIGGGSLGGKARGLAFLNLLLSSEPVRGELAGMATQIPQTFVVATDFFDQFMDENGLREFAYRCEDDDELQQRFLGARLPMRLMDSLQKILDYLDCPLAVRSSSLLEDDMSHPFAGIYRTLMLANNSNNPAIRLKHLGRAAKLVYASTFRVDAKAYIENTGHRIEQEKMAIVIERVVGQRYGDRFYPHFGGAAQSYNYYPVGPQRAEDGVAQLALGLGRTVVNGGRSFRFCPKHPHVAPQLATPSLALKNSQHRFFALDLAAGGEDPHDYGPGHLRSFDLDAADADGALFLVGSRYNANDDRLTESRDAVGPWVVTFRNVLEHGGPPIAGALSELIDLAATGMGCAVEIEFAGDLGDYGRRVAPGRPPRPPTLYALQLRPIVSRIDAAPVEPELAPERRVICRCRRAMGHGRYAELRDIVYVKPAEFDPAQSPAIAREVGAINRQLARERRPYVLIGPGRWGSSDFWLGIPVTWGEISGAKIIIEAAPGGYVVDPSQGAHFFHNITSLGIGYLTIPPGAAKGEGDEFVDWAWLDAAPAFQETARLRHVRLAHPLTATIDGRRGLGVIADGAPETES